MSRQLAIVALHLITILFVFSSFRLATSQINQQPDFYDQGIAERDSGDWQLALDIWLSGYDSLKQVKQPDIRLGVAFIELATQKKAENYYEKASEVYFWSLSKNSVGKHKHALQKEIARIKPLLNKEQHSEWLKLLKSNDSSLSKKIKAFWIIKDPVPTTEKNERLIEHWQRIAHAGENFKNEQTNVYGTDDRGLVYIKYGEPDQKLGGKLGTDQMEIMRWFPNDFLLRQEIQRFNNNPVVEIWVYFGFQKDASTVFIFGKKTGFGKYGLRAGLEEFIPNRAFRRGSTRTTQNVLPGAFLQLMYYGELIAADRFFEERFRELEALWGNSRAAGDLSPNRDVLMGLLGHYRSLDQDNIKFKYLPLDRTETFEGVEPLDLNYKTFRHLDDKNQTNLLIIAASTNKNIDEDLRPVFFKPTQKTKYKFRHVLLNYDENLTLQDKVVDYPASKNRNTSVFDSLKIKPGDRYRLAAEKIILDVRKARLEMTDISDTAKVIGMSSVFLEEVVPLSLNLSELEVSDLIVGVQTPDILDQSKQYPFPVIPKDPVKKTVPLNIYIELYNVSDKKSSLRVDCELRSINDDKVGKKKFSESFEVDGSGEKLKRVFSLDISKLDSGDYELTVKITGKNLKKKKVRRAFLRLIG